MKNSKQLIMITAAALLLTTTSCGSDNEPASGNPTTQVGIGNLTVAGQTSTRAGEGAEALQPFYAGDVLKAEYFASNGTGGVIGHYTYTAQGTWTAQADVLSTGEVPADGRYSLTKEADALPNQSTWQQYHNADRIGGSVTFDSTTGQLYTDAGQQLDHLNADLVIKIAPDTDPNQWSTGEFEQYIRSARIAIHSLKDDGNGTYVLGGEDYTPWLAQVDATGATLRLHIHPRLVMFEGEALVTIAPADGSPVLVGKYDLDAGQTFNREENVTNQRLTISFSGYRKALTHLFGQATIAAWGDGGSEELEAHQD